MSRGEAPPRQASRRWDLPSRVSSSRRRRWCSLPTHGLPPHTPTRTSPRRCPLTRTSPRLPASASGSSPEDARQVHRQGWPPHRPPPTPGTLSASSNRRRSAPRGANPGPPSALPFAHRWLRRIRRIRCGAFRIVSLARGRPIPFPSFSRRLLDCLWVRRLGKRCYLVAGVASPGERTDKCLTCPQNAFGPCIPRVRRASCTPDLYICPEQILKKCSAVARVVPPGPVSLFYSQPPPIPPFSFFSHSSHLPTLWDR